MSIPEIVRSVDRPDKKQLTLYLLNAISASILSCGTALPFVLLGMAPILIRYFTMRYRIDEEGVGIQWGWLFRQESYLTYEKIQDIHLNRGLFERWLGLGSVAIQTASGSAGAEITLIGLTEFDAMRDYLYERMRIGRDDDDEGAPEGDGDEEDALTLLRSIRDEVVRLREGMEPAA